MADDSNLALSSEDWAMLRQLLDEVLALPEAGRVAWVDALEPELARFKPRLHRLIGASNLAHADALMDALPQVETDQFAPPVAPGPVGPYRLLRVLGHGGMARVWLAERTDVLVGRKVALKLPRWPMADRQLAARLARERDILARLEHPNIARLYDAGIADDGQPWLAMEYVQGERLDAHVSRGNLDLPARLRLFLQVVRAVAHAHAQLVVHRDLKPSNILVSNAGEVKLLDFGIAKLLEGTDGGFETELTRQGGRALTPEFAAPEQLLGRPVTTAVDVYALGVVLFELLTGQRPYRPRRESPAALEEAILHGAVPRPSTVPGDARWRRQLAGDLDTIVLKALKKSPVERYGTALALADDIERYLARRPVQAQPDSRWYRLSRFVARHRLPVGLAAAASSVVMVSATLVLWQAYRAHDEHRRTQDTAQLVASLLRGTNPWFGGRKDVTAAELLRRGAASARHQLAGRPDLRASIQATVAESLVELGDLDAAMPIAREAVAAALQALAPEHPSTLHARTILASVRYAVGDRPGLRESLDDIVADMDRSTDAKAEHHALALLHRAHVLHDEGLHDAALADLQRAQALAEQALGPSDPLTLGLDTAQVFVHLGARRWDRALQQARHARQRILVGLQLPPTHPAASYVQLAWGMALCHNGQVREGLQAIESSVADSAAVRTEWHTSTAADVVHLADQLERAGRHDAALAQYQRALAISARVHGARSRAAARQVYHLGRTQLAAGQLEQALSRFDDALARYAEHPAQMDGRPVRLDRALALIRQGRLTDARAAIEATGGGDTGAHAQFVLGALARADGDAMASLRHLQRADAQLDEGPDTAVLRADILTELGELHLSQRRWNDAAASFGHASRLLHSTQVEPTPALRRALDGLARVRVAMPSRAAESMPPHTP